MQILAAPSGKPSVVTLQLWTSDSLNKGPTKSRLFQSARRPSSTNTERSNSPKFATGVFLLCQKLTGCVSHWHEYQGDYQQQPNLKQGAIFLCGHLIEASVASRRQSLQRQHGILAVCTPLDEFIGQKLFIQSL